MNRLAIIMFSLACFGCDVSEVDQCLRRELFTECMKSLPAGPVQTHYNDWDDVVSECESRAFYESHRLRKHIKPECRP